MKRIIIASSNEGKINEFKALLKGFELFSLAEFYKGEIEENGSSFRENALIKARAVYENLNEKQRKEFIVL
ncbi:MAG TPA: non-canonical purine NTP pyrophosphatase, partial [Campylobacter avium]|nr:non-canonical purine NTP pyrophosphatase [Campylobacter avium]